MGLLSQIVSEIAKKLTQILKGVLIERKHDEFTSYDTHLQALCIKTETIRFSPRFNGQVSVETMEAQN